MRRLLSLLSVAGVLALSGAPLSRSRAAEAGSPLRFRITLSREAAPQGASGRMLVFMSGAVEKPERLGNGFVPGANWMAAQEITHVDPGGTVTVDPDVLAYPRPFSTAKRGTYHFMALLDPDHSYPYTGQNGGDLYGPVVTVPDLDPAHSEPVSLQLAQVTPAPAPPPDTENVKLAELESPLLSRFWGRPIRIRAGVILPPGYSKDPRRRYPAVYVIHGFGGNHRMAWGIGPRFAREMAEGKRAEMVQVILDGSSPTGHHEFADSVNNGPWGRALTTEFIPYLERRFRLAARPGARFLTGHSSGGWSSLWLQITYPELFGGTWSTSPDPVDFRSFTGVDVTPGSRDNAYTRPDGTPHELVREGGRDIASLEQFARAEAVMGPVGGQFASFEWVFSPKGPDGRPLPLFNRETGALDPEVEKAWEKYDVRKVLEKNWRELGPKLKGKLHLIVGDEDTFHLEEAVKLLQASLRKLGSDAQIEIVPGRDHGNLYRPYRTFPDGLALRIDREMWAAYQRAGGPAGKGGK